MQKFSILKNKLKFSLSVTIMIFQFSGCDQFGSIPKDDDYLRMKKSSNYNIPKDKFINQNPEVMENMRKNSGFWANPRKNMANNYFFNSNKTEPETLLPEDKTSLNENFVKSSNNIKFAWLGHSSILMSINNKIILIDPIFSSSASPFSWLIKRYQPPVFKLKELPKVDFILISHDHYDHLDMKTIKFFNNNKDISFVVPLGVGSHLKKWGVENSRITEMDWWDTKIIKGIKFICTPAQHFSGRKAFIETQKSLWASWVVKSGKRSFYFSGDSGYAKHYKEIGDKYGPMEVVFMDSGQYNTRWREVHNMPEEVIKGFIDLKGENLIPIHWGMFTLAMHNWFDPPVEIKKRAEEKSISLITPIIGQVIDMKNLIDTESWWEKFINVIK